MSRGRQRIEPLPSESPEVLAEAPLAATGARGTRSVATMLHNQELYRVWRPLARYLQTEGCLPDRVRELVILRVAWLGQCDYIWGQHVLAALRTGWTTSEIDAIKTGPSAPAWDETEGLLLCASEEFTHRHEISEETWNGLSNIYSDSEMIELMMTMGHYLMVGSLFNSIQLEREAGVPGLNFPASD
jgi:4-carboxymuconolactone decarboxylase